MKLIKQRFFFAVIFAFLTFPCYSIEIEFTPILKATGIAADTSDNTFLHNKNTSFYSNNVFGIRLNWNIFFNESNIFVVHLKNNAQASNSSLGKFYNQDLFRSTNLTHSYTNDFSGTLQYDLYQEVDRLVYSSSYGKMNIHIGRQAISWGLGRFWQPLDIFGAFSPIELDREYKPGVDAFNFEWYPSDFSQLNVVYVATNDQVSQFDDSLAMHYQQQISDQLFVTLIAASLLESSLFGTGIESEIFSAGVRAEAITYQWNDDWQLALVTGLDYQFKNEMIFNLEYLYQSSGTTSQNNLTAKSIDPLFAFGLQKQLAKSVFAFSLSKNIYPLLDVSYVNLTSVLNKPDLEFSSLHQLNFIYSTSNESDLTLSTMAGTGRRLSSTTNALKSEFGHIPFSITAQFRYYF